MNKLQYAAMISCAQRSGHAKGWELRTTLLHDVLALSQSIAQCSCGLWPRAHCDHWQRRSMQQFTKHVPSIPSSNSCTRAFSSTEGETRHNPSSSVPQCAQGGRMHKHDCRQDRAATPPALPIHAYNQTVALLDNTISTAYTNVPTATLDRSGPDVQQASKEVREQRCRQLQPQRRKAGLPTQWCQGRCRR